MTNHDPVRRTNAVFNWVIAAGIGVGAVLLWLAAGEPGRPLVDGYYTCSIAPREDAGPFHTPGVWPEVLVEDGRVVEAFSPILPGPSQPWEFYDVDRIDRGTIQITIVDDGGVESRYWCWYPG